MENSLALLSNANRMLAEVKTVDDAKQLMDVASSAKHYAQKHQLGKDAVSHAYEIEIRAEIKLGEFLRDMEKNKGGNPDLQPINREDRLDEPPTYKELGITLNLASESQRLADLPEEEQEKVITKKKSKKSVIKKNTRQEQNPAKTLPEDKYQVIYADPPWEYDFSETTTREIENQYQTMELEDIIALPVSNICVIDCVIFLWATSPKLVEALQVMDSWKFKYVTCAIWDKQKIGMGYYFRQQHEILLIGKIGNPLVPEPSNRVSSIISSPRQKHSQKPDKVYEIIENMYPKEKKIELFARSSRPGWYSWGNEIS